MRKYEDENKQASMALMLMMRDVIHTDCLCVMVYVVCASEREKRREERSGAKVRGRESKIVEGRKSVQIEEDDRKRKWEQIGEATAS